MQDYPVFTVWVCVNQPESWRQIPERMKVCEDNRDAIQLLENFHGVGIVVIDRSSPGQGFEEKRSGVGWARKTLMDAIAEQAAESDLIISLDADTEVEPDYLTNVANVFQSGDKTIALSVPYFHRLTGDESKDRAILRYEIYLRTYQLNLWRIGSPYSFTALGSAMAFPVKTYRTVGGIAPKVSGEDFYFLQKLIKFGPVSHWLENKVYPSARLSDRVVFGTGAAMTLGIEGDWHRYPIYPMNLFDDVGTTADRFELLYDGATPTPLDGFFEDHFGKKDLWTTLAKNHKQKAGFVRACHERLDGLRILQYLHWASDGKTADEKNLTAFLANEFPDDPRLPEQIANSGGWSFDEISTEALDRVRHVLEERELQCRREGRYVSCDVAVAAS